MHKYNYKTPEVFPARKN